MRIVHEQDWGPDLGLVKGGRWREIIGEGVGARCRSSYSVEIDAAGSTSWLAHGVEAVYYVASGSAVVEESLASHKHHHPLQEGAMFHVAPGSTYRLSSADGARLVGGPSPADPTLGRTPALVQNRPGISLFHRDEPGLMVPFISQDARLIVWLGAGAVTANMNYVVLEPGERNREHVHAYSEDTIHILEGRGTAENVTTGETFPIGPGDTVHINVGVWHAISAAPDERLISVGGPCPADVDMLRAAGVDVDAMTARGDA